MSQKVAQAYSAGIIRPSGSQIFDSKRQNGVPGRIRTCDPRIRNPVLYPTELRRPRAFYAADRGRRKPRAVQGVTVRRCAVWRRRIGGRARSICRAFPCGTLDGPRTNGPFVRVALSATQNAVLGGARRTDRKPPSHPCVGDAARWAPSRCGRNPERASRFRRTRNRPPSGLCCA